MYEAYYGFAEKPFSLTPDPKYLYRSQSHANAFELLQYAIRRREGFAVVTGDIGTGKTTLCRALLEEMTSKETEKKGPFGLGGVSSQQSAFRGKMIGTSHSAGGGFALGKKVYEYEFDLKKVHDPVRDMLEENGWTFKQVSTKSAATYRA